MSRHVLAVLLASAAALGGVSGAFAGVPVLPAKGAADDATAWIAGPNRTPRIAWVENAFHTPRVAFSDAAASGAFGPRTRLLSLTRFDIAPAVAFDGAGQAIVAWRSRHPPYPRTRVVLQRDDGSFTRPVTISGAAHSGGIPAVAAARDGSAIAAWLWGAFGRGYRVQWAVRPAGGAFGPAETLPGAAERYPPSPSVAVSPSGRALLVWRTEGGVLAATGSTATGLGPPQRLASGYLFGSGQAIDDAGRAVVAWLDQSGPHGSATRAFAAIADGGGPFAAPVRVAFPRHGGAPNGDPVAAVAADGTALLAIPTSRGRAGDLLAWSAPPGAGFGAAQTLLARGFFRDPALAVDAAGGAALAFVSLRHGARGPVELARWPAGGAWSAPVAISDPAEEAVYPSIALDTAGRAVVGWQTTGGPIEGAVIAP